MTPAEVEEAMIQQYEAFTSEGADTGYQQRIRGAQLTGAYNMVGRG
jgi:hypothetical protein